MNEDPARLSLAPMNPYMATRLCKELMEYIIEPLGAMVASYLSASDVPIAFPCQVLTDAPTASFRSLCGTTRFRLVVGSRQQMTDYQYLRAHHTLHAGEPILVATVLQDGAEHAFRIAHDMRFHSLKYTMDGSIRSLVVGNTGSGSSRRDLSNISLDGHPLVGEDLSRLQSFRLAQTMVPSLDERDQQSLDRGASAVWTDETKEPIATESVDEKPRRQPVRAVRRIQTNPTEPSDDEHVPEPRKKAAKGRLKKNQAIASDDEKGPELHEEDDDAEPRRLTKRSKTSSDDTSTAPSRAKKSSKTPQVDRVHKRLVRTFDAWLTTIETRDDVDSK